MQWHKLFSMESAPSRCYHRAVPVGEKEALLFGGYSAFQNELLNDMWKMDYSAVNFSQKTFDLPGIVWTRIEQQGNVPAPRKGFTFSKVPNKDKCILYGGQTTL